MNKDFTAATKNETKALRNTYLLKFFNDWWAVYSGIVRKHWNELPDDEQFLIIQAFLCGVDSMAVLMGDVMQKTRKEGK